MTNIYPKDYFNQFNNKIDRASCFVLMPFDPKFSSIYETIRNALQSPELNFVCQRADDIREPHIIETILKSIWRAEFIIADLTERNPNVFYELGIAHCTKDIDKVVILTQNMDYVPFDLRQFRCIVYQPTDDGLINLKEELLKTFQEAAKHSFRLRIRENRTLPFDKKLAGADRNFYKLTFEVPHVGYGAAKLLIHFDQIRIDREPDNLETQFLFVTKDKPTERISHIPWTISLIQIDDQQKEAIISLDKD